MDITAGTRLVDMNQKLASGVAYESIRCQNAIASAAIRRKAQHRYVLAV
jgi:hypothetical protein